MTGSPERDEGGKEAPATDKRLSAVDTKKKVLPYCIATAGPGPASYKLPPCIGSYDHDITKWRGPAFSLVGRGSLARTHWTDGPGPAHMVQNTRFGKVTSPCVKFQKGGSSNAAKKIEQPKKLTGFQEEKKKLMPYEMKGFTLSGRHYLKSKGFTPAPNQYKIPDTLGSRIPDLKSAPAFSLQSRPYMRQAVRAPGPTEYMSVDTNLYKPHAPRAIVTSKRPADKTGSDTPGPTAYMANFSLLSPRAPAFIFGLKHSVCADSMKVPVDENLNKMR